MSEPENFLERWSKRKLAKGERAAPEQEQTSPRNENEAHVAAPAPKESETAAPESQLFDPASLPPIDSIGADTDVTAFLRPGVPPELTRAALRRAWTSDPAIKDFVGLVENGWDFNDPQAMPGFGSIGAGEVARLVSQAIGALPEIAVGTPAEPPKEAALSDRQGQPALSSQPDQPAANQDDTTDGRRDNGASQKNSDS